MLSGVKCTVSNCKYWGNGEHCDVSSIEVNVDDKAANQSEQNVLEGI